MTEATRDVGRRGIDGAGVGEQRGPGGGGDVGWSVERRGLKQNGSGHCIPTRLLLSFVRLSLPAMLPRAGSRTVRQVSVCSVVYQVVACWTPSHADRRAARPPRYFRSRNLSSLRASRAPARPSPHRSCCLRLRPVAVPPRSLAARRFRPRRVSASSPAVFPAAASPRPPSPRFVPLFPDISEKAAQCNIPKRKSRRKS